MTIAGDSSSLPACLSNGLRPVELSPGTSRQFDLPDGQISLPLTLLITGRHLSVDASFEVDGKSIASLLHEAAHADRRAIVVTPEDDHGEQFAKSLKLVLDTLPASWSAALLDVHTAPVMGELTIANGDGQRATGHVTLRPAPPTRPTTA
jgi:hypothetical protein